MPARLSHQPAPTLLGRFERGDERPQPGAAHIIYVGQLDDDLMAAGVQQGLQRLLEIRRRTTVDATAGGDDIDSLELAGSYLHESAPGRGKGDYIRLTRENQ